MVSIYRDTARTVRPLKAGEVRSAEGGPVYRVDCWTRLQRFIILGAESNFYSPRAAFAAEAIDVVAECLREDGLRTVAMIAGISDSGRAPKNEPALLALAQASLANDTQTRQAAFGALSAVARTGTHFLHFLSYREAMGGGWGRGLLRAARSWFLEKEPRSVAYQLAKYPSRDGRAMRDILQATGLARVYPDRVVLPRQLDERGTMDAVIRWGVGDKTAVNAACSGDDALYFLCAVDAIQNLADTPAGYDAAVGLIKDAKLPREALPTQLLNSPEIWEAMLEDMPITAMLRNLGKMASVGLLTSHPTQANAAMWKVINTLRDAERLRRGRVHPISILLAMSVYAQGHGERGSLTWKPSRKIVEALDEAFYLAFGAVQPTGQRWQLAVDVSGSMDGETVLGLPYLNARTAAAAMALVTYATEPNCEVVAFSHDMREIPLRPTMRLDEVVRAMRAIRVGGGTYCRLPIEYAISAQREVDVFVTYTDSEAWDGAGRERYGYSGRSGKRDGTTSDTLKSYRESSGRAARHAVVAFAANEFSIADPRDSGQMDFVGLDASLPSLLSGFALGEV